MQSHTIYVNVFYILGNEMPLERPVLRTRERAIEDAEEFAERYAYTLTDAGKIDLSGEFSEEYQNAQAKSYARELKADQAREAQVA